MKKILVILGSAKRNGNTELLVDAFIKGAAESGHEVTKIMLGEKQIAGCTGCNACKKTGFCIIKDDMTDLYPRFNECDSIILASPLYYWTISSRLKAFIERLYATAIEDPNPPLGRYEKYQQKECALFMTAEDNLFWTFQQAVSYYQFAVINYIGWQDKGMILAGGCGGTHGQRGIKHSGHLETAYEFGKSF